MKWKLTKQPRFLKDLQTYLYLYLFCAKSHNLLPQGAIKLKINLKKN